MKQSPLASTLLAAALLVLVQVATPAAQSGEPVARFSALAVVPNAPPGQAAQSIDIIINRWSTPAERDRINTTLLEQGPEKLLQVLREMPEIGRLTSPGVLGHSLRYVARSSSGGTDRLLILTDRPIETWEAAQGGRTLDYPFTVIELRMGPSGRGEGKITVAAKIAVDKFSKEILFEDYSPTPVTLQGLRREK